MVEYEDWGVNREAGGSTRRRMTVGHRGDQPVRRATPADPDGLTRGAAVPVGGTEASGTLHSK